MAQLPGPGGGEAKFGPNGEMLLRDLVNDDVPRCQVRTWRSARAGWRGGQLEPPCESSGTTEGSVFFLCCRNHLARIQVAGATDAFVQHCKNWGPRLLAEGQQYVPYFDLAVDDAPRDGTGKGKDSDGKGKGGGGGQYDDDLGSRVAGAGRWLPYAGHTGTGKPCKGKPWEYGRPYAGSDPPGKPSLGTSSKPVPAEGGQEEPKAALAAGKEESARNEEQAETAQKPPPRFRRREPPSFLAFAARYDNGGWNRLQDEVLQRPRNAAKEFPLLGGSYALPAVQYSAGGFLGAHCASRRWLGLLKRRGEYEDLKDHLATKGLQDIKFTVVDASGGATWMTFAVMLWLAFSNPLDDADLCFREGIQQTRNYEPEAQMPQRACMLAAMVEVRCHDIRKPLTLDDDTVSDEFGRTILRVWTAMPTGEGRLAVVHCAALTRSTPLVARFAVDGLEVRDQETLDAFLQRTQEHHIRPRDGDYASSTCTIAPGSRNHAGRGFGRLLAVFKGLSARVLLAGSLRDFRGVAAAVKETVPNFGEFLNSHLIGPLCWLCKHAPPSPADPWTGTFAAFDDLLGSPSLDVADLSPIMSRRNTLKFARNFCAAPGKLVGLGHPDSGKPAASVATAASSVAAGTGHLRNPLSRSALPPPSLQAARELHGQMFKLFRREQFPWRVEVVWNEVEYKFQLEGYVFHAYNQLVNSCMAERIRARMTASADS